MPMWNDQNNTVSDIREWVEELFLKFGVPATDDRADLHPPFLMPRNDRLLIRGPTLFETRGEKYKAHFLYKDYGRHIDVVIVAREQRVGGTADEKVVGQIENLTKSQYPTAWLIISGNGWSAKSRLQIDDKVKEVSRGNRGVRRINNIGMLVENAVRVLVQEGVA